MCCKKMNPAIRRHSCPKQCGQEKLLQLCKLSDDDVEFIVH